MVVAFVDLLAHGCPGCFPPRSRAYNPGLMDAHQHMLSSTVGPTAQASASALSRTQGYNPTILPQRQFGYGTLDMDEGTTSRQPQTSTLTNWRHHSHEDSGAHVRQTGTRSGSTAATTTTTSSSSTTGHGAVRSSYGGGSASIAGAHTGLLTASMLGHQY